MPFTAEAAFLIKHAKYTPNIRLLLELGELLAECASPYLRTEADQILAAPSHPKLLAKRGINPARLIAKAIAQRSGAPLLEPFSRGARRAPQASLTRSVRRKTGDQDTECRADLKARVLIVDDVLTTGATLRTLARLATSRGARVVTGVALCDASGR